MKVGDAVIVRMFKADLKGKIPPHLVYDHLVGIITEIRRPPGSDPSDTERQYKVFATDGRHQWVYEDELTKPE